MRAKVTWQSNRTSATQGDISCRPIITEGPNRKMTVTVDGSCALQVKVTYSAPGTRTYLAYKETFPYKV